MALREPIDYDAHGVHDLDPAVVGPELRAAILDCIAVQKARARAAVAAFRPHSTAAHEVSAARLAEILARGADVHGIASDRSISNVIPFSARHIADAVRDHVVEQRRRRVDRETARLVRSLFRSDGRLAVVSSGHLWYPPGAYMGWHTNAKAPGWRIYVSYVEEAGRSFFRYRDPATGAIVTLRDQPWSVRIFRITREQPLWHAVHSETHRFSMGYLVVRESVLGSLLRTGKRLARAWSR